MSTLEYIGDCTTMANDLPAHSAMMGEATAVTYRTFRACVGAQLDQWALDHLYVLHPRCGHGVTLKHDWHVGFFRSHWYGSPCYYLVWSGFEHVWVKR